MTNTNCLEGVRCPRCGNEDAFHIDITAIALVTDDGAEVLNGDYCWDANSYTSCVACGKESPLSAFLSSETTEGN